MHSTFAIRSIVSLIAAWILMSNAGCAIFEASCGAFYTARVDPRTTTTLSYEYHENMLLKGLKYNYEELRLELDGPDGRVVEECVARWETTRREQSSLDCVMREAVEARADDSGDRVWFVDTWRGRVLATVDRTTCAVTGPDDPVPIWAGCDAGRILERCPRFRCQ